MAVSKATLQSVDVGSAPIDRYRELLDPEAWSAFDVCMREFAGQMRGRTLWNVNSTPRGGGVAELLAALIPYDRGAGIDERWLVIEGSAEFFAITKKIHTLLHGVAPDGSDITAAERREYEQVMTRNAAALLEQVKPDDVVLLHDPQTAGLVATMSAVPPSDARLVVQVSRWDRLKDPVGLAEAFANHVAPKTDAWLVLAGPAVDSVDDDPEQPQILADLRSMRDRLRPEVRDRIVVALLPMQDVEENAAIVNALQRRADVVVQKSLAEGFGLTVAEAMWKGRPVVASRVGGIEDQIEHQKSGFLIDDPTDLEGFGSAVVGLLQDHDRAAALGREARRHVIRQFLAPRHLMEQAQLITSVT